MNNLRTQWTAWNNAQLIESSILEIGDGYRAKNSEMGLVGLPFARAGNIDNGFHFENADLLDEMNLSRAGSKISRPGDVVFTSKGTVGRFAFVKPDTQKFVYSPQLCYWRIKDSSIIDPRYLFYWMHGRDFTNQVHQVKGLTDMADYVSLGDQRQMKITAPPLSTQHKIAAILSAYDDLIENNTRRIAILEEMAQTLYREWFVHFRYPGHEKNRMVESAIGMIPEGWEVVKFTDIANILSGGTPKTHISAFWNGPIPFFTPKDAMNLFYVTKTEKNITALGLKNCSSRLYPKNTVFITARGTVGKVLLSGVDMAMNQSCYALQGQDDIDQLFIFLTIRNYIDQLKQKSHGAVFDTIIVDTFKLLNIVKPSLDLIGAFCLFISPIFENVLKLINKNLNLRRTRDLLLPKLISGEVDVERLNIETGGATSEAAASIEDDIEKSAEAALAGEQMMLWGSR